jgi:predicted metal-dependent phosphoesterase TrpH
MIDLHSHTTASDGQYPPEELVRMALKAGITRLALTDHDTVAGISAARASAQANGLELIAGIELSATLNRREVHVLGHFVEPLEPELARFSESKRSERHRRMEQMIQKLRSIGIPMTLAEVEAQSGGENLGRPHLARALLERGLVSSVKEAFDRYLGNGCPAFVEREELLTADAIGLIHRAGGTATLAHPGVSKVERFEIERLKHEGLDGLEVHHSDQGPSMQAKYLEIAHACELVPTAGSDFHGELVAPRRLLGSVAMAEAEFERLRARAKRS